MTRKTLLICCLSAIVFNQNSFAQKWNLKQCVDAALARNLTVLEAATNNETKRIDIEQAKYQRYPNLSFLGKETGYHYFSTSDLSNNKANSTVGNYGFNSSVVLYNGGQLQKRIQQHSLDYQAGKLDIEKNKVDMSLNIVNGYLQILYNYEQLDLSKEILNQINKQYENTQMLVKYGSLPQTNLTQMKAQVASQKFAVTQAESNLYISKVNLMLLMEIPVVDNFDVEKPVLPDSSAVQHNSIVKSQEIYAMALGNQPQIKSAKLKADLAQMNADIARTAYYPTLSANANVGSLYSSTAITKTYQDYSVPNQLRDNMSTSLGLSLS